MAHVFVATNLWDSDEAIRLGELLNDDDAWRYLIRLWAWGIDADCESGSIRLPPRRLAQVCGFSGDPSKLHNAMVESGWLKHQDDGSFLMRGWDCTTRYFKERRRLKAFSEKRKEARHAEKHANATRAIRVQHATATGDSSSSSSSERRYIQGGENLHDVQAVQEFAANTLGCSVFFNVEANAIAKSLVPIAVDEATAAGDVVRQKCKTVHPTYWLRVIESGREKLQANKASPAAQKPAKVPRRELDAIIQAGERRKCLLEDSEAKRIYAIADDLHAIIEAVESAAVSLGREEMVQYVAARFGR